MLQEHVPTAPSPRTSLSIGLVAGGTRPRYIRRDYASPHPCYTRRDYASVFMLPLTSISVFSPGQGVHLTCPAPGAKPLLPHGDRWAQRARRMLWKGLRGLLGNRADVTTQGDSLESTWLGSRLKARGMPTRALMGVSLALFSTPRRTRGRI